MKHQMGRYQNDCHTGALVRYAEAVEQGPIVAEVDLEHRFRLCVCVCRRGFGRATCTMLREFLIGLGATTTCGWVQK